MVYGEVVGLMNGKLVMGGILEGDCTDRMADRLYVEGTITSSSTNQPYGMKSKFTVFC